jgi:hypothetical protein
MTKDEAEREAIRRFSQLPPHERQQYEDAEAYSKRLEAELDFHTVTNKQKLIAAWLVRDMVRAKARSADKPQIKAVALADPSDVIELVETPAVAA